MINYDSVTKTWINIYISPQNSDHRYRMLMIGGSGSVKQTH